MTMNCAEVHDLLNARLDGPIDAVDEAALRSHLAHCATCRAAQAELTAQHARLRAAFVDHQAAARRVADRVAAEMPRLPKRGSILPWLAAMAAAAAGFAIARVIARQPRSTPVAATQPAPDVAHLTVATGAVFCCPTGAADWSPLATGGGVAAGTQLRTGPGVRCEVRTGDGSEIRLDEGTTITLASPRRFELANGQAWSSVSHRDAAGGQPFEAVAHAVTFTALGTQFDLHANWADVTLTVAEGRVRASGKAGQVVVPPGQQLTCTPEHLGNPEPVQNLVLATRWVNEILIMKGRDDPELAKRIDDLFAQIGESKMDYLYEDEIRALGDHCVVPLTRYIESRRSAGQEARRAAAARIVADVAPPWAIPELLNLLKDDDGYVRSEAARALRRLTGQSLGRTPEQWRQDSRFQCEPTVTAWENWWAENRERYPGAGRGEGEAKKG